jgi:hypothetical protein
MPERTRKESQDINQFAASAVRRTIEASEAPPEPEGRKEVPEAVPNTRCRSASLKRLECVNEVVANRGKITGGASYPL